MTERATSPHDALCRRILGRPENAASELRSLLPEPFVALVDWATLQQLSTGFISTHLTPRYGDMLFSVEVEGQTAFIYCLIEHQSRTDKLMALRLVEYMVNIWTRYAGDHPGTTTLPLIVPLVVHADPKGRRWRAETELSLLLGVTPRVRESLGELVPRFRYVVDDLAATDLVELRKRPVTPAVLVMLYVLQVASRDDVVERLFPLVDDVSAMFAGSNGIDDLTGVVAYIMSVSDLEAEEFGPLLKRMDPQVREAMMTTAEKLEARGEARGEVRGEVRGAARALLALLSAKFGEVPEEVTARVRSATLAELDRCVDRILTAETVEDVFR
ncbi:Rpn family recombination-promoting nuclease/putative transposase [Nocardia mangyaensis]|uniref:Rpn family recombination-promoting nuclease/putative transposase n=1 Tax=Nocardia mangyaensis TaxID=2213200 RepID=UPI0026761C08|nr:Rpn family recombination-promoting nuclease/putative transposase [Nocardia mangyaensis]MDO3647508.1 Rpn family recombination-promoting nuclease/putative transposase [Nocardia mangyaensis]